MKDTPAQTHMGPPMALCEREQDGAPSSEDLLGDTRRRRGKRQTQGHTDMFTDRKRHWLRVRKPSQDGT